MNEFTVKVTKPNARKIYRAGYDVLLIPCKARVDSMWGCASVINIATSEDSVNQFDRAVGAFMYYNCHNYELGYYPHFYVRESDINKFKEEQTNGTQKEAD